MSDMNIPGVKGTYDSYVEALMKVERVPRDNAQKDLDSYNEKKKAWQSVNRLSADLRRISNKLYSYENPFAEKKVDSSNERAITATAKREAENAKFKLRVDRVASSDSFLSLPVDKKMNVPQGTYTFIVGDKTISFNWKGGNYRSFMEAVNKRSKGVLSVSEIRTSGNSTSLLFKSEIQGEENRLQFEDDALVFALKNGILKENDGSSVELDKKNVSLAPRSSETVNFSKTVRALEGNILEIRLTKHNSESSGLLNSTGLASDSSASHLTENKTFEELGSMSYQGITITNAPSASGDLPATSSNTGKANPNSGNAMYGTNYPSDNSKNLNIIFLQSSRGVLIPAPPIADIESEQKITIDLSEYGDIKAISFNNSNAQLAFDISNIRVYDPKSSGKYSPANPVSLAQDAIIDFEGIKIQRSSNEIDDLIPGVTLTVHDKTDGTEIIEVKADNELVKNSIIEFVASYNKLLSEINILTQLRPEIVEELSYLTDEEREAAYKRLGLLSGDSTLSSIKNKLRVQANSVYKADDEAQIILLKNMGISTNSSLGGEIEAGRLRGYLEIDEGKLDEAIKNNLSDIKVFFAFDKNGDMLMDSGLAFTIYEQMKPYVERGGIFANKINTLDGKIKSSSAKISEYDKKLAKKEKDLKQKYHSLEGTLQDLSTQSDKIKSFSNQYNKGN